MPIQRALYILFGGIMATAALLAGLYFGGAFHQQLPQLLSATLYPADFPKLADFALSDQNGQTYTQAELHKRWSLLFFGYTYCPDICPTTLHLLNQLELPLGGDGGSASVEIVFISVDPERDNATRLKEYMGYFNPRFTGLTGEHSQIDRLTRSLGAYYHKRDTVDGNSYLVDHSAALFLINPAGKPQALFSPPHTVEKLSHDIQIIIEYFKNENL